MSKERSFHFFNMRFPHFHPKIAVAFSLKIKKNLIFQYSFKNYFADSEKCSNFARCLEQIPKNNNKIKKIAMSKICQITGKKAQVGNNVSHSKHRTKRRFDVNLFSKKFYYVEEECWISLKISAAGLRLINKVGLDAALKQAVAKGHVDWKDIKVIGD